MLLRVVVDNTPLIVEVKTLLEVEYESVLLLTIVEVERIPLIVEDNILEAELSELEFTKLVVLDETTPFTLDSKVNEFVEVEIVKVLLVIIEVVACDPPRLEVKTLEELDKVFVVNKLVMKALVVVAFSVTDEEAFRVATFMTLEFTSELTRFVRTNFVLVEFPERSERKVLFSVQADPFQMSVVLVAVPIGSKLLSVVHLVDVPVDIKY